MPNDDVPESARAEPMTYERFTRPSFVTSRNLALQKAREASSMEELKEAARDLQVNITGARSKADISERINAVVHPVNADEASEG